MSAEQACPPEGKECLQDKMSTSTWSEGVSADCKVQLSARKEGVSAEQSEAVYLKGNECHHLPGEKECLQNADRV